MKLDSDTLNWLVIATTVASFTRFAHNFNIFSVLAWPGTVAHETAHWLVSLLLLGQPADFKVWPTRQDTIWTLGQVTTRNVTWYNQAPIALAPLLWLPGIYLTYEQLIISLPAWNWQHGLVLYLMAAIIHSSIPSAHDWRLAAQAPLPILLLALISITLVLW